MTYKCALAASIALTATPVATLAANGGSLEVDEGMVYYHSPNANEGDFTAISPAHIASVRVTSRSGHEVGLMLDNGKTLSVEFDSAEAATSMGERVVDALRSAQ
ncbi:hypothetical protein NYO91_04625 [Arhodomonas aquaeolei]|uniref:hypothetical protein n=1 Tax=Arhodomonas aquaeolei TaxID=2369 RepID=UPI00216A98D2|nr:hypothetical protein [Arhodomonas aquaeolei]MCS4503362.1 hypothetical protein [Arhodomonas aquaeolei]